MTDARVTQTSVEQWSLGSPAAQVTQLAIEQWSSTFATSGNALVTQLAVEQWSVVASTTTARKRRHVTVAM